VREVKTVGIVALGSDDGLCGAYNINLFKQLLVHIGQLRATYGQDISIHIYPVGSKMMKAVAKIAGQNIRVANNLAVDSKSSGDSVKTFVETLRQAFENGEVDRIDSLYMNFISVGRQQPKAEQFLPVVGESFTTGKNLQCRPYIFEPDADTIFSSVLPLYLLSVMQEVFSENRASEQAARVMAMQSANDNANKLLEQLQLEYNKLRQQSITTELLDILGGQVR
jgi:F-type H+-transporting ATPase subunit gamma